MAPHVDRHIDRKHALTHDINAEDEILLTQNPARDQQVVRKAYADSLAGGAGTFSTFKNLQYLSFFRPDFGTFRGVAGAGTRSRTLTLYAGTGRGDFAKVGWYLAPQVGSPGAAQSILSGSHQIYVRALPQGAGSRQCAFQLGADFPQSGTDYILWAGSNALGFSTGHVGSWYGLARDSSGVKKRVLLGNIGANYEFRMAWQSGYYVFYTGPPEQARGSISSSSFNQINGPKAGFHFAVRQGSPTTNRAKLTIGQAFIQGI